MNEIGCVLAPPGVVTTSVLAPAVPTGVTAVIEESDVTIILVAATPPIVTLVAPVKLVPFIVIKVEPVLGPEDGVTLKRVGGAI